MCIDIEHTPLCMNAYVNDCSSVCIHYSQGYGGPRSLPTYPNTPMCMKTARLHDSSMMYGPRNLSIYLGDVALGGREPGDAVIQPVIR